ncbi:MAG: hypothetical protein HY253_14325 [Burkholderiales bacterium]|nr:hypothetical protein [Burkholderiales bacterium]
MNAIAQTCSQCGWSFDHAALASNTCRKCQSSILIVSVSYLEKFEKPAIQKYISQYTNTLKVSPEDKDALLAMSICYLKLSLFDQADRYLYRLIDAHPFEPAGYYYRAITTLKGKRPRIVSLSIIREAEKLIETASELDPANGRYEILLAALRHDYYALNGMRIPSPEPEELIKNAMTKYVDSLEVQQIFKLINVNETPMQQRFAMN